MTAPIRRVSAMGALQLALDAVLSADAALVADMGTLGRAGFVYSTGSVPKGEPAPWIELTDSAEGDWGFFAQGGNASEETLVIVTPRDKGKPFAGVILRHLVRLLDDARLTVDGHDVAASDLSLVTVFPDPDGEHLRTVCRLSVSSLTQAPA